jgi:hypothetical protein
MIFLCMSCAFLHRTGERDSVRIRCCMIMARRCSTGSAFVGADFCKVFSAEDDGFSFHLLLSFVFCRVFLQADPKSCVMIIKES